LERNPDAKKISRRYEILQDESRI